MTKRMRNIAGGVVASFMLAGIFAGSASAATPVVARKTVVVLEKERAVTLEKERSFTNEKERGFVDRKTGTTEKER